MRRIPHFEGISSVLGPTGLYRRNISVCIVSDRKPVYRDVVPKSDFIRLKSLLSTSVYE